jgi:transcriptional regulator with XRE-family HTH domain
MDAHVPGLPITRNHERHTYNDPVLDHLLWAMDRDKRKMYALAELAGYSQPTLSNLRRGRHAPIYFLVRDLAQVLGYKLVLQEL